MSLVFPFRVYLYLMLTSGFNRKVNEIWDLLGYYAAYSDKTLQSFGLTYRSHPQGSRNPRRNIILPMGCPETSVTNYHYILRNSPEEHRFPIVMSFI
jgi:hypothetical protein